MNYALAVNHDLAMVQSWSDSIARCVTRFDPLCRRDRLVFLLVRRGGIFRLPSPGELAGLIEATGPLRAAGCRLGFYTGGSVLPPADRAASMTTLRLAGVDVFAIDQSAKAPEGTIEHNDLLNARRGWLMEPAIEARMRRFGSGHQRGWSVVCQDHLVARTVAARALYLPPRGVVRQGGRHFTLLIRDGRGDPWKPGECFARARRLVTSAYEIPVVPLWELSETERAHLSGNPPSTPPLSEVQL